MSSRCLCLAAINDLAPSTSVSKWLTTVVSSGQSHSWALVTVLVLQVSSSGMDLMIGLGR